KRRAAPMIATDSPGPMFASAGTCIYPPKPRNGIKVASGVTPVFPRALRRQNCANADQALTQSPLNRGFSAAGITVLTMRDTGQECARTVGICREFLFRNTGALPAAAPRGFSERRVLGIRPAEQRRGDEVVGAGAVAGDRYVPHHRDPDEGLDVGVVRLRAHRIPEEDQHVEASRRDERADLLVAAEWAALEAGDGRAEALAEQPAGGAGRVQDVVGEDVPVVLDPLEEVVFPVVVGDQGDALLGEHANFAVV